ncbi:MAG: hypothetical protein ABSH32_15400 [Bryobacteraceae bacterium]
MKIAIAIIALAALVSTTLFFAAPFQAAQPDFAAWAPSGALLYLQARDFGALLRDWNGSAEKRAWLDSANYEVFTRSRLFGRLEQAWQEFAAAAGFRPDMQLVESISGGPSALALYDIGKLEFLYISEVPAAHAMENLLWQSRAKYESREAGGSPFYVRVDPASGRVVAFAVYRDYVLLGTREELVAGALRLLAGEKPPALDQDPWFRESVRAASSPGDLRLVMNLETIIRTPYFRSYWIERNTSTFKPYWAAIADVTLARAQIREDRLLLRRAAEPVPKASVTELTRLVPDDAGLYRAWASPDVPTMVHLIRDKLLAPEIVRLTDPQYAPPVPESGNAGTQSDLETRIDEPPLAEGGKQLADETLRNLLAGAGIRSVLHVQTSRRMADGVFVETPSAIALLASAAWDANAVRAALAGGAENVEFTVRGNLLVLANSTSLLNSILSRVDRKPAAGEAVYMARFRHAAERANFDKMMAALDYGKPQPAFFSGNMGSLSRVLSRVATETVTCRDTGTALAQTIIYETPEPHPPL